MCSCSYIVCSRLPQYTIPLRIDIDESLYMYMHVHVCTGVCMYACTCMYVHVHCTLYVPMCVKFSRAPMAFLCTFKSCDRVSVRRGGMAPWTAISLLLASVVAKVVRQLHTLHCTSESSARSRITNGGRDSAFITVDLFSAEI